jgi:hypothetical protein
MRKFICQCGQPLFFENTRCVQCKRTLGYDAQSFRMLSLEALPQTDRWQCPQGQRFRLCQNYTGYNVCNWLIKASATHRYCLSCRLNQIIPSLSAPENRRGWARMEIAKRYLIYGLMRLHLPIKPRNEYPEDGLGFAFIEDKRSNPDVEEDYVLTGHAEGLITVNLIEADVINREQQRISLGESYRTLLGHFRHESGHYFFSRLLASSIHLEEFRELFGDERIDYQSALERYHCREISVERGEQFISDYAQAHPHEDWAECWAHYLHMHEALETAVYYQLLNRGVLQAEFNEQIQQWITLSLSLNALNRGMGLNDAYPFVLSTAIIEKLFFVHRVISEVNKSSGNRF